MVMRKLSEFGGMNLKSKYCKNCTNEKGKLKDFDIVFKNLVNFYTNQDKISTKEAEKFVNNHLRKMNAWGSHYDN